MTSEYYTWSLARGRTVVFFCRVDYCIRKQLRPLSDGYRDFPEVGGASE